jgi:hypothetical protein
MSTSLGIGISRKRRRKSGVKKTKSLRRNVAGVEMACCIALYACSAERGKMKYRRGKTPSASSGACVALATPMAWL